MSPHGLGLTAKEFWNLTPREYYALSDIAESEARRWAIAQALKLNLNLGKGQVPFVADDFLGLRDREKLQQEKMLSDMRVARMNQKLAQMFQRPRGGKGSRGPQAEPEGLPMWARRTPPPDANVNDGSVRRRKA